MILNSLHQRLASQFRHQATPGSFPESPAAEFFQCRARTTIELEVLVTVLCCIDLLIGIPFLPLSKTVLHQVVGSRVLLPRKFLGPLGNPLSNRVHLAIAPQRDLTSRKGLLPAIPSWQVATMPLCPDMMNFTQQAILDQVHGIIV